MANDDKIETPPSEHGPEDGGVAAAGLIPTEAVVAKEGGGEDGGAAAEPSPPSDFAKEQLLRRVGKLTAQKKALEAQLVAAQAGGKAPAAADEAEFLRRVEAKAEELAEAKATQKLAKRTFDQQVADVLKAGKEAFGKEEFQEKVNSLISIRDEDDPEEMRQYGSLIHGVLKTSRAPQIIALLGGDLELASKLMRMDSFDLGRELAKLEEKEPAGEVSKAPKPIIPVGSKGRSHEPLRTESAEADRLSTREWMNRRAAHADQINKEVGRRIL